MGLETPTYITDLNDLWPLASDNVSLGDDHLRAIKTAIQGTFNGFTGAVTDITEAQLAALAGGTATHLGRIAVPQYACMYEDAVQSTSSTSWSTVSASGSFTEILASGITTDVANARFTITSTGVYYVSAAFEYGTTSSPTLVAVGFSIDGSSPAQPFVMTDISPTSSANQVGAISGITSLTAAQTIEMQFRIWTGTGNLNLRDISYSIYRIA